MDWEIIKETISTFFSQPVPIIGCSIGFALAAVLKVISNTSIGKKALNKLTNLHNEANTALDQAKVKVVEYEEKLEKAKIELINFKENKEKEIQELKSNYEVKLSYVNSNLEQFKTTVLEALNNVNNVNIKNIVENYISSQNNENKTIISDAVEQVKQEYSSTIEDLLKRIEVLEDEKRTNDNTKEEQI